MRLRTAIAVCTHNPDRSRFTATLEGLRSQTLGRDKWQLIIVDNASASPFKAEQWSLTWHPNAAIVREEKLGLTAARLRAIACADADCMVFVDDDNVLAANYLETVSRFASERPDLGAWGGNIVGQFDAQPAAWCEEFLEFIAVRSVDRDVWTNAIPVINVPGAGMAVRTTIAKTYAKLLAVDAARCSLDRKGTGLGSCGDTDIGILAAALGYSVGIFTDLELRHIIPQTRLSLDYLRRLAYAIGHSDAILYSIWGVADRVSPQLSPLGRLRRAVRVWQRGPQKRKVLFALERGRKAGAAEAARLGIAGRVLSQQIERAKAIHREVLAEHDGGISA